MPPLKGMAFPLPAAHSIAAAAMHEAQMPVRCSSARAALPRCHRGAAENINGIRDSCADIFGACCYKLCKEIIVISCLSIASSQVRLALLSRQQPLMRHAILVSLGPIAHRHLILPS